MLRLLMASSVAVFCVTASQRQHVQQLLQAKGKQQIQVFDASNKICKKYAKFTVISFEFVHVQMLFCLRLGYECDYVIVSCVAGLLKQHIESRPSRAWRQRYLSCLGSREMMTSIVSRARKGVMVVG